MWACEAQIPSGGHIGFKRGQEEEEEEEEEEEVGEGGGGR